MADNCSYGTVVAYIISFRIKERGLEDSSREVDAVEKRVVESVHRLRCAAHSSLIYGLMPVLTEIGST